MRSSFDFRKDRQRDTEAARVGWQTLRFTYTEIIHDPEAPALRSPTSAASAFCPRK